MTQRRLRCDGRLPGSGHSRKAQLELTGFRRKRPRVVSQGGTVWRATHGEQRRDRVERRKKKKERGSVWWAKEAPCGGPKLAMAIVCRPLGVPCLSRLVAKKERKPEVGRPSDTVVVLTIAGVASSTLRAALRKNLLFFGYGCQLKLTGIHGKAASLRLTLSQHGKTHSISESSHLTAIH